ncbi:unnamed protein product (mitochondrion) [Plasmodiophora brassicae]|uniref:Uncharacterized protein n=1 Tax=Plasmodiophora brassicae TaxID=37360 RepID=A0A3P3Y9C6_PLABS|nr:unnamed protein product [Plasmodiophora brassicae]
MSQPPASRAAAEVAQRNHPQLKPFYDAMLVSMQAFEKAREWPDLIKCLGRVNKVLAKYSNVELVPMALTVAKRLAQCLNPVLPGGVHLKTLETYKAILERIGSQRLAQDLSLYSAGLFPLLSYASTRVKPELLDIYEQYFVKLDKKLLPCLGGFILALLPGLDEGSGDVYNRTLKLLDQTRQNTSAPHFALALWRCLLQCPSCRPSALRYICSSIPAIGTPELEQYLPPNRSIAIKAIVATLHDKDVLAQRAMFDLLISHFPLVESLFTRTELIYLVQATLPVILRRETSVNRRFYSWLLGQPESVASAGTLSLTPTTLEMVVQSLVQIIESSSQTPEEAAEPFNIARTLMEREEIRASPFLSHIAVPLIKYAYESNLQGQESSQSSTTASFSAAVLKAAQSFFNHIDLDIVWKALEMSLAEVFELTVTARDGNAEPALVARETAASARNDVINLVDFALDFLPVHFIEGASGDARILASLIDIMLRSLYRVDWGGATSDVLRAMQFTSKLLSTKFSGHSHVPLKEWKTFLLNVPLPVYSHLVSGGGIFDKATAVTLESVIETDSRDQSVSTTDTTRETLVAVAVQYSLMHSALLRGNIENQRLEIAERFASFMMQSSAFPHPELACLSIECWLKLVKSQLIKYRDEDCSQAILRLWDLLDRSCPSTNIKVAKLISQLHVVRSDLCECAVADAMLQPFRSREDVSDRMTGYKKFALLWKLQSTLETTSVLHQSQFHNALSLMLDALTDDHTPIKLVAYEWLRESTHHIARVLDPIFTVLLCPSTFRSSPDLHYDDIYDTGMVRHALKQLVSCFSTVHADAIVDAASQVSLSHHGTCDLLKRHLQRYANLPHDMTYVLPQTVTYLDLIVWSALRFTQGIVIDIDGYDQMELSHFRSANTDVRLAACDLLVILVKLSSNVRPASSQKTPVQARAPRIVMPELEAIGSAVVRALSGSLSHDSECVQVSLLNLVRHIVIENNRRGDSSLTASPLFSSTLLSGIERASLFPSVDLLSQWINVSFLCLPHLGATVDSLCLAVVSTLCGLVQQATLIKMHALSRLLHGLCAIVHYYLLDVVPIQKDDNSGAMVPVDSNNATGMLGFLGGIFSAGAISSRNDAGSSRASSRRDGTSTDAIIARVVDGAICAWLLVSTGQDCSPSDNEDIDRTKPSNILSVVVTLIDPLLEKYPLQVVAALLLAWQTRSLMSTGHFLCQMLDILPKAVPDLIIGSLAHIANLPIQHRDLSKPNSTSISDATILHFADEYVHKCKKSVKLTDTWPRLLLLFKIYSQPSLLLEESLMAHIWLLSITHEFVIRTSWSKIDPKATKDIRDMVQGLLFLCSSACTKSSNDPIAVEIHAVPLVLTCSESFEGDDDEDDDVPPLPSWHAPSKSSSNTVRLLSLRSLSNVAAQIIRAVWPAGSPEDDDKACATLATIVPYFVANIENRSLANVEYAYAASVLFASLAVNKHKFSLRVWKREAWSIFQHNDFFDTSVDALAQWRIILTRVVTEEPPLLTEQLMGRHTNSQVALFTSHKSDVLVRSRQLKRLTFMIHAGRVDQYARYLPTIVEKLVESLKLEDASPLHAQVLFCIRILIVRVSPEHLTLIWPVVLMEIISVLDESADLDLLLEACKFVDLAIAVLPSQFQLYQWMFLADRMALALGEDSLSAGPEKAAGDDLNRDDADATNRFSSFQPHIRVLGQRLRSSERTRSINRNLACSLRQLRQFHYQISEHVLRTSLNPVPADFDFIDGMLLFDFVSYGDEVPDAFVTPTETPPAGVSDR